jgi:long-subunit fatty acid transport protein
VGEYSLAGAINLSNILYAGASLGFHSVRFYEDIVHIETDYDNHVIDFDEFQFREFNSTRGWGYTFRMGMLVRPFQMLRVGASLQLPTKYFLTDEKFTDMDAYFDSSSGIADSYESSDNGIYDYELKSPMRVQAHASLILFRMATISAAYEYVDYSSSRLEAFDYEFIDENDEIRRGFQAAHNLRAGGELRLKSLYLRTGLQFLMSPFTDTRNNAETWIYSGGLGYRTNKYYVDLSYSHSSRNDVLGMYSYTPGMNEVALNRVNGNNAMLTLGFKF